MRFRDSFLKGFCSRCRFLIFRLFDFFGSSGTHRGHAAHRHGRCGEGLGRFALKAHQGVQLVFHGVGFQGNPDTGRPGSEKTEEAHAAGFQYLDIHI